MERTFPWQQATVAGQRMTSYISHLSRSFYIELPKVLCQLVVRSVVYALCT